MNCTINTILCFPTRSSCLVRFTFRPPEKYVQFAHDYNRLRKLPSNLAFGGWTTSCSSARKTVAGHPPFFIGAEGNTKAWI